MDYTPVLQRMEPNPDDVVLLDEQSFSAGSGYSMRMCAFLKLSGGELRLVISLDNIGRVTSGIRFFGSREQFNRHLLANYADWLVVSAIGRPKVDFFLSRPSHQGA